MFALNFRHQNFAFVRGIEATLHPA